ncbi:MAG TPA: hypothetical protein VHC22_30990 [Pirellulales bacterium]|nr:hypothetical protein [Pirellulales bacterium]
MSEPSKPYHDTTPIFRLLRQVRQLLRGSWVATGLALSIAIYLGTLLVLALLDLVVPFLPTMRAIALGLIILPTLWVFFVGVLRPLFRRLGHTQVARRVEQFLPGIHNRLVSCVDLSEEKARSGYSPEFYRRLVGEALERVRAFKPATVVDRGNLQRALTAFAGTVALFVVCWILLADRLPTAMARIFQPWADIPPATGVAFDIHPGDAKILRGDEIEFAVDVTKGQPEQMRVELMPDDGSETIWHDLQPRDGAHWTRTLEGLEKSFSYRVHGGGTWSKKYKIVMVDRPKIIDLRAVLHYPDYFELGQEGIVAQPTTDVTGPETSGVEVRVESEGDVAEGEIQLLDVAWEEVPVANREERVWFERQTPTAAVSEGQWQWDNDTHARPTHTEPPAAGVHGHRFHTAKVGFQIEPGEYLFAWVYLVPQQKPETIMLEWHDGQNWEHRAYWGDDKIAAGQPNTESRRNLGPLPEAGKWVRLEVPAKQVGLENKAVKGMSFTLHGGQCYWHVSGALPPPTRDERKLVVRETFALASQHAGEWTGTFPLLGEGFWRVELRNELRHANQAVKEAKYLAIHDNPPQVTLERPGTDIVLSQAKKVPLTIAAYDDFALKHLKVLVQRGDSGGFRETAGKKYGKQVRGDTALVALDLLPFDLKPGEHVRYRVQVEDRKGQVAETQDYVIRIAADGNSADQQLARFEQQQDSFTEKLAKLIAEQATVKEAIEKLEGKYAPLEKTVEEAEAKAREAARQAAEQNPQAQAAEIKPELDAETTKQLNELRQELAQAAAKEQQNANVGKQLADELMQAAQQAAQLQMLPPELVSEMRAAQTAFDRLAVKPMEELAKELQQAASPQQNDPNLGDLSKASDHIQDELEALAARLKALDKAREQMDAGMEQALAQLRNEMERQQAAGTQRGLEDLRDMLAALREQLQKFEGKQAEMLDASNVVPDMMLADLEKRQQNLERESDPALEEARQLLAQNRMNRRDRRPQFPDAPMMGEDEEYLVPPKEEDTTEEMAAGEEPADAGEHPEADADMGQEDEPLFEPALGGPQPKLDPRFADKRPHPRRDADAPHTPAQAQREALADRQFHRLEELDLSQQSLGTDMASLEALMEQLQQALAGSNAPMPAEAPNSPGAEGAPHAEQAALGELLQSPEVREAMALAQRLRQAQNALAQARPGQPQKAPAHTSRGMSLGNLDPTATSGQIVEVELSQLDPQTRVMILKMQPKLREELLQGMREQGPEGYRKFIQDYFKRLSEVKAN